MRKMYILCDGGLGNRLCSLIGGLITADKLDIIENEILWPETNYCNCNFNKLFNNQFKINNINIDFFLQNNLDKIYLTHLNIEYLNQFKYVFPHCLESLEKIKNMKQDILYSHCSFSKYISKEEIINKLKILKINKEIRLKVYDFCEKNKIDNNVIGIHLRRTDFKYDINDNQKIIDIINNNQKKRFFICSDDKKTEELFKKFKNVVLKDKYSYVEKLNKDKNWVDNFNEKGTLIKYNVKRTEDAVIEGFIDMLILSRTNLDIYKSVGSFYLFGCYFNKIVI